MNIGKLEAKLISAARKASPGEQVPYAFEKRIMANLNGERRNTELVPIKSLWSAAISCVAITLLCGIWSFSTMRQNEPELFTQSFEEAVYATIDQHVEDDIW